MSATKVPPPLTISLVPAVLNLFFADFTVSSAFPLPINLTALLCSVKSEFSPKVALTFELMFIHFLDLILPSKRNCVLALFCGLAIVKCIELFIYASKNLM